LWLYQLERGKASHSHVRRGLVVRRAAIIKPPLQRLSQSSRFLLTGILEPQIERLRFSTVIVLHYSLLLHASLMHKFRLKQGAQLLFRPVKVRFDRCLWDAERPPNLAEA
jgi:hypothetical protein